MEKTSEDISERYLKKIKEDFPDLLYTNATLITRGWDYNVITLDDEYIFRFPKNSKAKEKLTVEINFLKYFIGKVQVSIPNYIYIPKDLSFGGYGMLKGEEMTPDVYKELGGERAQHVSDQLGPFLSELHSTPDGIVDSCGMTEESGGYRWSKEYSERSLQLLRSKIFPRLSPTETTWIEHQFDVYLSTRSPSKLTVTHGDFNSKHILIDSKQGAVTGILDFGNIGLSDPAFDFGGFWYFGEASVTQMLSRYTGDIDEGFVKRSLFPVLVNMLGDMVDIEEGRNMNATFEDSREKLAWRMQSGLSL